jgi:hypothetical protein
MTSGDPAHFDPNETLTDDVICVKCHYLLRSITHNCPECGTPVAYSLRKTGHRILPPLPANRLNQIWWGLRLLFCGPPFIVVWLVITALNSQKSLDPLFDTSLFLLKLFTFIVGPALLSTSLRHYRNAAILPATFIGVSIPFGLLMICHFLAPLFAGPGLTPAEAHLEISLAEFIIAHLITFIGLLHVKLLLGSRNPIPNFYDTAYVFFLLQIIFVGWFIAHPDISLMLFILFLYLLPFGVGCRAAFHVFKEYQRALYLTQATRAFTL